MSDFFEDSNAEEKVKAKDTSAINGNSKFQIDTDYSSDPVKTFELLKKGICEHLLLEYYYESSKIHAVEFIDSESLLNTRNHTNNVNYKNEIPSLSIENPNSKNYFGELDKQIIKKVEKNKILLTTTNQIFDNIIEFVKYGLQKWSIESIMKVFDWKDFEILIRDILGEFGYRSIRTFRFSSKNKRHEIDIIAKNRDTIFFIDGKHWQSNTPGLLTFRKIAEQQKQRVDHLIKDSEASGLLLQQFNTNLDENQNKPFKIYPIIVISFNEPEIRWVDSIPIVPIHTFNQFIIDFHLFRDKFYFAELKRATIQQTLKNILKHKRKSMK
jgi:Holliday junction resolvase-like predicted endonuclease